MIIFAIVSAMLSMSLLLSRTVFSKNKGSRKKKYASTGLPIENPKKDALRSPGYYDDIVNREKFKRFYKWELHQFN